MSWKILKIYPSPMQNSVTITNDDECATATTDYHAADRLARSLIGLATLSGRGYGIDGHAVRTYVSQAY